MAQHRWTANVRAACRIRFLAPGFRGHVQGLFEAQERQLGFDQSMNLARPGQCLADTHAVIPRVGPVGVLPDTGECMGVHAENRALRRLITAIDSKFELIEECNGLGFSSERVPPCWRAIALMDYDRNVAARHQRLARGFQPDAVTESQHNRRCSPSKPSLRTTAWFPERVTPAVFSARRWITACSNRRSECQNPRSAVTQQRQSE